MKYTTVFPPRLKIIPVTVWAITFAIGTLLLLLLLFTDRTNYIAAHALTLIIMTVVINILALVFMVAALLHLTEFKRQIINGITLLLSNVPVAFFYFILLIKYARMFN